MLYLVCTQSIASAYLLGCNCGQNGYLLKVIKALFEARSVDGHRLLWQPSGLRPFSADLSITRYYVSDFSLSGLLFHLLQQVGQTDVAIT